MRKILLDTNAYTAIRKNDQDVISFIHQADSVIFSVVVLGELIYGFMKGGRDAANRTKLLRYFADNGITVNQINSETAEIYAEIKLHLQKKGKPIPENDIWIAAQTIETGSILVTYDKHFLSIPGLRLWRR